MASWKRWPLSWAFRVSRQVLTMKRRREELEEAPEPENGGLSREHAAWWELERVWHKQSTKSKSGYAESSGWRGQGPKLSHPHSYCLSLLPIANVHKCWLFFLIYQGSVLSILQPLCQWRPPIASWRRSSYSVHFTHMETELRWVMTDTFQVTGPGGIPRANKQCWQF